MGSTQMSRPTRIAGIVGAKDISVHAGGGCAIVDTGLKCWGSNVYGQLGTGGTQSQIATAAMAVPGFETGVTSTSGTNYITCAAKDGAAYCWGARITTTFFQERVSALAFRPERVIGMEAGVTAVAAGWNNACGIKNGSVHCWGYNATYGLGDGTNVGRTFAAPVLSLPGGN